MNQEYSFSNCRSYAAMVALLVAACSGTVLAQSDPAPPSRAEVKAETRAAEKAHQLVPAGEGASPSPASTSQSTKTRAQRKAETQKAIKAGELMPAGDAGAWKAERTLIGTKASKTRGERKAETLETAKEGKLTPAGEGPGRPSK